MSKQLNKFKIFSKIIKQKYANFNKANLLEKRLMSTSNDLVKSSITKKIGKCFAWYYGIVVGTCAIVGAYCGIDNHFDSRYRKDPLNLVLDTLGGGVIGTVVGALHPLIIISAIGIHVHDKYVTPITNLDDSQQNEPKETEDPGFVVKMREYAPGCTHHVFHGAGNKSFVMKEGESSIFEDNDGKNVIVRFFDCDENDCYGHERISSYGCHTGEDTVCSIPIEDFQKDPCKYLNSYLIKNNADNKFVKMCLGKRTHYKL